MKLAAHAKRIRVEGFPSADRGPLNPPIAPLSIRSTRYRRPVTGWLRLLIKRWPGTIKASAVPESQPCRGSRAEGASYGRRNGDQQDEITGREHVWSIS